MLENRSATVAKVLSRAPRLRSEVTNDPLRARMDRNTARGRRIADLYLAYMAALGHPDTLVQANVMAASELRVASEDARAKVLDGTGNNDDRDQLVPAGELGTSRRAQARS
jgi:hypothetical protein